MSSSMLSPCVAQPGIAGTSAQKPPSSASCTTILIFTDWFSRQDFRADAGQIQAMRALLFRRLRVDLARHLSDGACELVGGLGARDGVFLRKDKSRHAGDALFGGFLRLARDQGNIL